MQVANWIDIAIIGFIALSAVMSAMRGFIKEAFSLVTWVLAIWIGLQYFEEAMPLFKGFTSIIVQKSLAFSLLFFGVLIVGGILNYCVSRLLRFIGFGFFDRILGLIFGVARGTLVVALAVLLVSATPLSQEKIWKDSKMIGEVEFLIHWMREIMPADVMKQISDLTAKRSVMESKSKVIVPVLNKKL